MNTNSPLKTPEIKAALIDMDGVLYDSMPHHARAWRRMLLDHGIDIPEEEMFLYEGMTGAETIDLLFRRELNRPATAREMHELYKEKASQFARSGAKEIMPGAGRMMQALIDAGLPRVLVTGSAQGSLLDHIDADYPGAFPPGHRVTALDVTKGKPDPEPYLKGAEIAGAPPQNCMVVENAPLGVRAGKAAGCFTVAVTTGPIPRDAFVKEGADLIFPSMDAFALWAERTFCHRRNAPLAESLDDAAGQIDPDTVTVVTDSNVERLVLPLFASSQTLAASRLAVIAPGEDHKDLDSVVAIWNTLEAAKASRRSLAVNIGGGLVTDTGGFAAATYKRGIATLNVPTTLLGAVDAATGGKTGINFNGLKNEIGAFHIPRRVIISARPLKTLPHREILSGYAEMVKTALIADAPLYENLLHVQDVLDDENRLEDAMKRCVEIKEEVVAADPKEQGLRKILNFGHTAGHAFESLAIERHAGVAHGEAVAHGMLVALILSHIQLGFPSREVQRYASAFLKPFYPALRVDCNDIPQLIEIMGRDKKNTAAGRVNFTLLRAVGEPLTDCTPDHKALLEAIEIYRDMTGQ